MGEKCGLRWYAVLGVRATCTLDYAHGGLCSDGTYTRKTVSAVAAERFQQARGNPQALTPPPEPLKVLDPKTDCYEFLARHLKLPDGKGFRSAATYLRYVIPGDTEGSQTLPFQSATKTPYCCGVLDTGNWHGGYYDDVTRAAFHVWVDRIRQGDIRTMVIMSTTSASQSSAEALLREAGFTAHTGRNANSGNRMTVWILNLYPEE